jgi:hypothetical protein
MAASPAVRRRPPAPEEHADARQQLGEGKRLDEVVVGTQREPLDAVGDLVAGGEEQDRRREPAFPPAAAEREAVAARKHRVEHDGVVLVHRDRLVGALRVGRHVHGEPLLGEAAAEKRGGGDLVLDDQELHRRAPLLESSPRRGWVARTNDSRT